MILRTLSQFRRGRREVTNHVKLERKRSDRQDFQSDGFLVGGACRIHDLRELENG
jgi:hypothetical protein